MPIEVRPLELYGLADGLRGAAGAAGEATRGVGPVGPVGDLAVDAAGFVDGVALAAEGLVVELGLLAGSVTRAADSWLALDAGLLARRGQVRAR